MNAPLASSHFAGDERDGPRFRVAGEMVLDSFHRDGRVDDRWLGLGPREFALLWRLAETPGERLAGTQLRGEGWHIAFDPGGDGLAAELARVRDKLAAAGVGHLICSDGDGCHFLDAPPPPGAARPARG